MLAHRHLEETRSTLPLEMLRNLFENFTLATILWRRQHYFLTHSNQGID